MILNSRSARQNNGFIVSGIFIRIRHIAPPRYLHAATPPASRYANKYAGKARPYVSAATAQPPPPFLICFAFRPSTQPPRHEAASGISFSITQATRRQPADGQIRHRYSRKIAFAASRASRRAIAATAAAFILLRHAADECITDRWSAASRHAGISIRFWPLRRHEGIESFLWST